MIINKENQEAYIEKCNQVGEHWGEDLMPMMAMEEAAELSQAISKYARMFHQLDGSYDGSYDDITAEALEAYLQSRERLIEELGDMYIAMRAIMHLAGIPESRVWDRINEKLNKKY